MHTRELNQYKLTLIVGNEHTKQLDLKGFFILGK